MLSYILIGIIWYFADEKMKNDNFVKYHVKQGLILLIAWILYGVVLGFLSSLIVSTMGFYSFWKIVYLLKYLPWIFVILGVMNTINDQQKPLPFIGKFAEKWNF
jgi:uncharacterized membrane protein